MGDSRALVRHLGCGNGRGSTAELSKNAKAPIRARMNKTSHNSLPTSTSLFFLSELCMRRLGASGGEEGDIVD